MQPVRPIRARGDPRREPGVESRREPERIECVLLRARGEFAERVDALIGRERAELVPEPRALSVLVVVSVLVARVVSVLAGRRGEPRPDQELEFHLATLEADLSHHATLPVSMPLKLRRYLALVKPDFDSSWIQGSDFSLTEQGGTPQPTKRPFT